MSEKVVGIYIGQHEAIETTKLHAQLQVKFPLISVDYMMGYLIAMFEDTLSEADNGRVIAILRAYIRNNQHLKDSEDVPPADIP